MIYQNVRNHQFFGETKIFLDKMYGLDFYIRINWFASLWIMDNPKVPNQQTLKGILHFVENISSH